MNKNITTNGIITPKGRTAYEVNLEYVSKGDYFSRGGKTSDKKTVVVWVRNAYEACNSAWDLDTTEGAGTGWLMSGFAPKI